MNRKALNFMKLIPVVAIAAAIGLSAMSANAQAITNVRADEVDTVGNAYTLFASKDNFTFDTVWGYNETNDDGILGQHSVIGFDVKSDVARIDRLTVKVFWKEYHGLWNSIWKTNPTMMSKPFTIYSSDELEILSASHMATYTTLPAIGTPGSLAQLEISIDDLFLIKDVIGAPRFQPLSDCSTTEKDGTVQHLEDKDYYVVIPVKYSYYDVMIAVAGLDSDGNYISDGFNEDGSVPTDPTLGDYITVTDTTATSVYFTSAAALTGLQLSDYSAHGGVAAAITVQVGDYNYTTNGFDHFINSYDISAGEDTSALNVSIPAGYEVVVFFEGGATGSINIYYSSATPAVLVNLWIDGCGLQCGIGEITPPTDWEKFLTGLGQLLAGIGAWLVSLGFAVLAAIILFKFILPAIERSREKKTSNT